MTTTLTTATDEARRALKVLDGHLRRLLEVEPETAANALYHVAMVDEALHEIEFITASD